MDGQSRDCFLELNENCEELDLSSEDQVSPDALRMEGDFPMAIDSGISKDYMLDVSKPRLGMVFQSDGEAFEFYNRYAKYVGFSVRKNSSTLRANKMISKRIFCCSKEGFRRTHTRGPPMKARPATRIDCKARLVTKLQADGKYYVIEFVKEHNHELEPSQEAHSLSLLPNIQAEAMDNMNSEGTVPQTTHSYVSAEHGGFPNLNSKHADFTNCFQRRPNEVLEKGGAQFLLDYLRRMQKENPCFFYSFQMSEDNRLASCFWCDAKSMIDYSVFGDVVCFDTTYKTIVYEKPYAPFVGVNSHGQFILFGCAVLFEETLETMTWLFQTFLTAMNRKQPKTLFTDQTMPMADAVRQVLPNAYHRFYMWHMYQYATDNLPHAFEKSPSFVEDFKSCIYDNETEEELQTNWNALLEKYDLVENQWFKDLFKMREKWGQAYGHDHFCAGLGSKQSGDDMEKFLKKYLKRFLPLREFVTQYEKALIHLREKENHQNSISVMSKPELRTRWPAEARAAERYTRKIFMLFQDEYVSTLDLCVECIGEDGPFYTYKVSSFQSTRPHIVTFDSLDSTTKCACKRFESMGILCAHALKVLHRRRLLDLPSQYYLKRWTKDAGLGAVIDNHGGKHTPRDGPLSFELQQNELAHMAFTLAARAASTEKSAAFAKLLLARGIEKLDNFMRTELGSVSNSNADTQNAANHTDSDRNQGGT